VCKPNCASKCNADIYAYDYTQRHTNGHSYGYIYDHAECYDNRHSYSYCKTDAYRSAQRNTTVAPYAAAASGHVAVSRQNAALQRANYLGSTGCQPVVAGNRADNICYDATRGY
jgi:hypothetical protein